MVTILGTEVTSGGVFGTDGVTGPRAFISYAHDDPDHEERVRAFWWFLRLHGVDARYDGMAADEPQNWVRWMSEQVDDDTFILVVVSPQYRAAAEGRVPKDVRRGVQWETQLIQDLLYADIPAGRRRVLAVVLPSGSPDDIPRWLFRHTHQHYTVTGFDVAGCESLLRVLLGRPLEVSPDVGAPPLLPPRPPPDIAVDADPSRHATADRADRPARRAPLAIPWLNRREVPRQAESAAVRDLLLAPPGPLAEAGSEEPRVVVLHGAGGFGKTTVARLLVHEQQIQASFPGGIVWITIGPVASGAELAGKISDVCATFTGTRPSLSDPGLAGSALADVLGDRRALLVLDDVWNDAQLEPWLKGGYRSVRLVTTRNHLLLPRGTRQVEIGAMSSAEARALLTASLGQVPPWLAARLLRRTGHWPLLLSLINAAAQADVSAHASPTAVLEVLESLDAGLAEHGPTYLDPTNDDSRSRAVATTVDLSLARLNHQEADRFAELAAFADGVAIPVPVLERFWQHTGSLSTGQVRRLCQRLMQLSLLTELHLAKPAYVRVHVVIHDYLARRPGADPAALHRGLLDAHRPLCGPQRPTQWERLPLSEGYLWRWVPEHLARAGLADELSTLLRDPSWLLGKISTTGPAGLENDLRLDPSPTATAFAHVVRRTAHLLAPLEPKGSLTVTLASRVPDVPALAAVRDPLLRSLPSCHLWPHSALPDLPHPALVRVLIGHTTAVTQVVADVDGTWVASADRDGTVRVWDATDGTTRHLVTDPTRTSPLLLAAPDGSWLAVADAEDPRVVLWNPSTGERLRTLTGHATPVSALAGAPDGSWLATGSWDGEVAVWDAGTGARRTLMAGQHAGKVRLLAALPDGQHLVTTGLDRTVALWDVRTGRQVELVARPRHVTALAAGPGPSGAASSGASGGASGAWIAVGRVDGIVEIWSPDLSTHRFEATLGDAVTALATGWDDAKGDWLAAGSADGAVRFWNVQNGRLRFAVDGRRGSADALVAAPDGSWLATAGATETIRIWDVGPQTRPTRPRLTLVGHTAEIAGLAVTGDGGRLITAGHDTTVRVWDPQTPPAGSQPLLGRVTAMTVAADGTWVASGFEDGAVRLQGIARAHLRTSVAGHLQQVTAIRAAPNGAWIVTGSRDGLVRVSPLRSGLTRRVLADDHAADAHSLLVAPITNWVLAAARDGSILVIEATTGRRLQVLRGTDRPATHLAVAPDSTWLASGHGDGHVHLYHLIPSPQAVGDLTLPPLDGPITALSVAPDGTYLAYADTGGRVRLQPLAPGPQPIGPVVDLTGHQYAITAIAVDGRRIATAGRDGTARTWHVPDGTAEHVLAGHDGPVHDLAYSQDGRFLITVGDRTVRAWSMDDGSARAAIRVEAALARVEIAGQLIVAAGDQGPYLLTLHEHADRAAP